MCISICDLLTSLESYWPPKTYVERRFWLSFQVGGVILYSLRRNECFVLDGVVMSAGVVFGLIPSYSRLDICASAHYLFVQNSKYAYGGLVI